MNMRCSDTSGMILFFSSCRSPAAENSCSDCTEVAGEDKNTGLVLKESGIIDYAVTTINSDYLS